jgi:threonine/homoserine/homoserine lactone efflux protein
MNPKPILFFTALFPQFLNAHEPLLPQFFILTGIFMAMSLVSLLTYGALARRARRLLRQPRIVVWLNRLVGSIFVAFGLALLRLKRSTA